jgi:glycerol-1-phosphate dehydrogenase [NAD(P)+]
LINHQVNTEDLHEKVTEAFKHLDESGKLAIECWSDYGKKVQFWKENLLDIERELQHWQIHASELRLLIKTPEEIIEGLVSAGSPGTFDELDPTFDEDVARWAVANCHFMRNRFTGIDLLQFLGLWDAEAVDWVFERCRQAFLTKLTNGVLR